MLGCTLYRPDERDADFRLISRFRFRGMDIVRFDEADGVDCFTDLAEVRFDAVFGVLEPAIDFRFDATFRAIACHPKKKAHRRLLDGPAKGQPTDAAPTFRRRDVPMPANPSPLWGEGQG